MAMFRDGDVFSAWKLMAIGALACTLSAPSASAACMRLPLSDVAFGKGPATEAAREKLTEYAAWEAARRGWPKDAKLRRSNETVSCKVYLDLGPIGTEYRCRVTATYCTK